MFSFFHRTPTIHVDCFTSNNDAYKFTPVVPSVQSKPSWFNSIVRPGKTNTKFQQYVINENGGIEFNNNFNNRTLRSCYGFLELYKKGFIVENWCDLVLDIREDGKIGRAHV